MCNYCLKHGPAGKWYFNARNYSTDVLKEINKDEDFLKEFLLEQYKTFEAIQVRKIAGFSAKRLGYKIQMPIIGRVVKHIAEKMLHNTKPKFNPFKTEGHIGQVIPLDDAISILENCVDENTIIMKYCMCRYMTRAEKEACCINFGVMSEIIDKLPRFIPEPEDSKYRLTREEAIEKFTEFNKKGYVGTIWYAAYPYINNLCACKTPECVGFRPRLDFGIKSIFKAEYVVQNNPNNCQGCKSCLTMCQFGAIGFNESEKRAEIDLSKCYGCGVCLHACKYDALNIVSRNEVPAVAGQY
ncbi:MAG: 4Fe-4S dicluster domain-containing protein [Candidatus Hermodarchaeota archaeon]